MKKISLILIIFLFSLSSCATKKVEDPLILPPDFGVMPDLNNKKNQDLKKDQSKDIERIKDLLLEK